MARLGMLAYTFFVFGFTLNAFEEDHLSYVGGIITIISAIALSIYSSQLASLVSNSSRSLSFRARLLLTSAAFLCLAFAFAAGLIIFKDHMKAAAITSMTSCLIIFSSVFLSSCGRINSETL